MTLRHNDLPGAATIRLRVLAYQRQIAPKAAVPRPAQPPRYPAQFYWRGEALCGRDRIRVGYF